MYAPERDDLHPLLANDPAGGSSAEATILYLCKWGECKGAFPNSGSLRAHVLQAHVGRSATKDLAPACRWGTCTKVIKKRDHLTSHLHKHIRYFGFSCDFCGKSFQRNHDLTKHKKTHGHQGHPPSISQLCQSTPTHGTQFTNQVQASPIQLQVSAGESLRPPGEIAVASISEPVSRQMAITTPVAPPGQYRTNIQAVLDTIGGSMLNDGPFPIPRGLLTLGSKWPATSVPPPVAKVPSQETTAEPTVIDLSLSAPALAQCSLKHKLYEARDTSNSPTESDMDRRILLQALGQAGSPTAVAKVVKENKHPKLGFEVIAGAEVPTQQVLPRRDAFVNLPPGRHAFPVVDRITRPGSVNTLANGTHANYIGTVIHNHYYGPSPNAPGHTTDAHSATPAHNNSADMPRGTPSFASAFGTGTANPNIDPRLGTGSSSLDAITLDHSWLDELEAAVGGTWDSKSTN